MIAVALVGTAIGLLVGWGNAEARIRGGPALQSETTYFVSAVFTFGAVGGLIGLGLGALVARSHPVVSTRALLRGTAFWVLGVGLVFAVFLRNGCHAWVPVSEQGVPNGLLVRCVDEDRRVAIRIAIGVGAAVVALSLFVLERELSARRSDARR